MSRARRPGGLPYNNKPFCEVVANKLTQTKRKPVIRGIVSINLDEGLIK